MDYYWYCLSANGRIVFRQLMEGRAGSIDVSKMTYEQVLESLTIIKNVFMHAAETNKVRVYKTSYKDKIEALQKQVSMLNYIYELLDRCKIPNDKGSIHVFVYVIAGRDYVPKQNHPFRTARHLVECVLAGDISSVKKMAAAQDMIETLEFILSRRDGKNLPTSCAFENILATFETQIKNNIESVTPRIKALAAR